MRIGVIGLGFMGSTHLKALANIPGAKLTAVMDVDEKRLSGDLSGIQGNLGGPGEKLDFSGVSKYKTVEDIVADPEVDAVDVCLPTYLHAPVTLAALRGGKHVLVEKPMALDGQTCDLLTAEADKQGRILMVAQVLRFVPAYMALRSYLQSGCLGAVRSAFFRRRCAVPTWGPWEFDSKKSGGGVFDLLIHDVDMCQHVFGLPTAVSAVGHEDMAHGIDSILAQFEYPEIGSVAVTGGWHHLGGYPFSMEFTVIGDGGVMEFNSFGRPATLFKANGESETPAMTEKDCYQAEIEYFVECCSKGEKPSFCPPVESAISVKLALMMLESRNRKGERIECKL